ncbi:hypothetical protein DSO57_1004506 [Entomophthora muscae]|uniref:Uncharacterized protein n=1 Tax=Entomophthora muscae TaxID=34485 RepID=A0ACC2UTQ4_9FUNG|nr:hypothetical protein DSO57_1004506 [Entomophthora muscae]
MLIRTPQLWDLNPDTQRAASLQIFGLKPEQDLTSGNPLEHDEPKPPTLTLPTLKVPVKSTYQWVGQAIDPKITRATAEWPPRDDQPHNLTRKFEYSKFESANELTPAKDATKDCKNLVDSSTQAKEICKSLPMADGNTYTLDRQEVAHCHSYNKSTSCSSAPHTHQPQETADQPPKFYCSPGASFGPVQFTEYPPNPAYLEFTLEEILIYNLESRNRKTETVYREGIKVTIPPLLFWDKYNYFPAYLVSMRPSLILRPDCPQESVAANESTSTQIFGWSLLAAPAGYLPTSSLEPPTGLIPENLPPDHYRGQIPTIMKKNPAIPPLPDILPAQDFSKLGVVYITVLRLANQAVPQTGIWCPWATSVNYLIIIAHIVYMAFQAQPASPVGVQPDSGMGCDT